VQRSVGGSRFCRSQPAPAGTKSSPASETVCFQATATRHECAVMKVRFQADADFNQNIVRAVRRHARAIDPQTAHEAGLHGLDDDAVLDKAAHAGRRRAGRRKGNTLTRWPLPGYPADGPGCENAAAAARSWHGARTGCRPSSPAALAPSMVSRRAARGRRAGG
jgi:hypothetical protein